ncbi:MAG TPA: PepSY domain-containing protein [Steroidobacteraceae bacterium]|jgi:hypothetical protein|nr:PepSY domain-containing protein [Steroidobacteraceae bacterium]
MESNAADSVKLVRRSAWVAAVILLLGLAGSCVASAVEPANLREISREQATQELQKRYGTAARVIRTDVIEQGGHHVYVFRLLSANGRVWVVRIDAQSGAEVP